MMTGATQLQPPPITLPDPPRRVRRKMGASGVLWLMRIFILPHTLAGIAIPIYMLLTVYVACFGTPLKATVDDRTQSVTSKGKTIYSLKYHYTLNNRRIHDNDSVSFDTYVHTKAADTFPARAGAFFGHPLFIRTDNWMTHNLLPMIGFTLFWDGIVGAFFYMAWVDPIRQRLLVRTGAVAAGTVSSKEQINGKQTKYRIRYTFTSAEYERLSGKIDTTKTAYYAAEKGHPCTIIYDPARPARNVAYEFSNFTVLPPF